MLVVLMAVGFAASASKAKDCDLSSISVGDKCQASWSSLRDALRPTQDSVGYAWVFHIALKDMQSEDDAQSEMDDKMCVAHTRFMHTAPPTASFAARLRATRRVQLASRVAQRACVAG